MTVREAWNRQGLQFTSRCAIMAALSFRTEQGVVVTANLLAGAAPVPAANGCTIVNGLRMHYLEWGLPGNQPLVLLHGMVVGGAD
jgi:hypothetical protein